MSVIRGYPAKLRVTDIMVVVASGSGNRDQPAIPVTTTRSPRQY
jgi:hypothetical protein